MPGLFLLSTCSFQLKFQGFIITVDHITLAAADIIPEFYLDIDLLGLGGEMHQILLRLGLHRREGQIDDFLDLPSAVSHKTVGINADFKPGFVCLKEFLAFTICCGHIQDHFA